MKLVTCDIVGNDVYKSWKCLRDAIYESSVEVLGFCRRKHQDWFDEKDTQIKDMLDEMHTSNKIWITDKKS